MSDESGQKQVYVQPFPDPSARWQTSTLGGSEPAWSPTGEELFYRVGSALMSVPVDLTAEEPTFGNPVELFSGNFIIDTTGHPAYAVDPSGESFIMYEASGEPLTKVHIVLNWVDELERLLPPE